MANRNKKTKKENRGKSTVAAASDKLNDRLPKQKITDTLFPAEQITPEKAHDICEHDHSILLAQQATLFDDLNGYEDSLEKLVAVLEDNLKKYPDGFLRIDAKGAAIDFFTMIRRSAVSGNISPIIQTRS